MTGLSVGCGLLGRRGASSSRFSGPSATVVGLTPVSMATQSWLSLLLSKDYKGNRGSWGGVLSWVARGRPRRCLSCRPPEDGYPTDSNANLGEGGTEPRWSDPVTPHQARSLIAPKALFLPCSHLLLQAAWDVDIVISMMQMSKLKLKGLA